MTLVYHPGQIEVQEEANSRNLAENLARWVGPVGEFCRIADMVILAADSRTESLHFSAVSGQGPLVEIVQPSILRLPAGLARLGCGAGPTSVGGIAISLAQFRRARLNGRLTCTGAGCVLETDEAFTNCRKYIAPSVPLADERHIGAVKREAISLEDPYLVELIAKAETTFLASVSPDGCPDVSHRGGQPGFISFDPYQGLLSWPEYVGDGMFKSAGNIRATGKLTLLVLDFESGNAVELSGRGVYETLRHARRPRTEGLEQHQEQFPVQGKIKAELSRATLLRHFTTPRQRIAKSLRMTSASPMQEQAPQ